MKGVTEQAGRTPSVSASTPQGDRVAISGNAEDLFRAAGNALSKGEIQSALQLFGLTVTHFPLSSEAADALRLGLQYSTQYPAEGDHRERDPFSLYRAVAEKISRGVFDDLLKLTGLETFQEIKRLLYAEAASGGNVPDAWLKILDRLPQLQFMTMQGRRELADLLQFPALWKQVLSTLQPRSGAEESDFRGVWQKFLRGDYRSTIELQNAEKYANVMKVLFERPPSRATADHLSSRTLVHEFPVLRELPPEQRHQIVELLRYPEIWRAAAAGMTGDSPRSVASQPPLEAWIIIRRVAFALYGMGVFAAFAVNVWRYSEDGGNWLSVQLLKPVLLAFVWPVAGFYR